ncbi:putative Beta-lactamase [Rhodospirillaceae bacterium LM-1]|nr:putative Beta-lactamase [Rhodospirillaceae bacterium LM-1]
MNAPPRLVLSLALLLLTTSAALSSMPDALEFYAKGEYEQAAQLANQLAGQGNREAERLLGEMHENGRGTVQNDALAWAHYSKAAQGGDTESQYRLGQMHESGRGVPQSFSDAVKWYQRASLSGHAGAKARLGKLALEGKGGKVSFNKGVGLIAEAALMGEPEAETQLAELERRGLASARQMVGEAPADAESAAILAEVETMIHTIGAPLPLGPDLRLGGKPFIAKQGQNSWTLVLPKPETGSASEGAAWKAASIRMTVAKSGDGNHDIRISLPSLWRHVNHAGRETGRLEIGRQSVTALWSPAQHQWLRHHVMLNAIKLISPEGDGHVESVLSLLETQPGSEGKGTNLTQRLRLQNVELKSAGQPSVSFDLLDASSTLESLDVNAYRSGIALSSDSASLLAGMTGKMKMTGIKLLGGKTVRQDIAIGSLEVALGALGLDQATSRLSASFEATNISGRQADNVSSLLPANALPDRVVAKLSWEKLPLRDLSHQVAAMLMQGERRQANAGQMMNDALFDIMATFADALIDAKSEIKIEEISATGQDWGIEAKGLFSPERGQTLPFSGVLSITGQGLDGLIKTLDDGSSFAAVMLDGLRRTSPPKKDEQGRELFEVTFGADGAIDINGQRWSAPDAPAKQQSKPGGKPVPPTKIKK